MTVDVTADGAVWLRGDCPIEDAEVLLGRLAADPEAVVDWTGCQRAHTAVVQVLMAARPAMTGLPAGAFLRCHVAPLLDG